MAQTRFNQPWLNAKSPLKARFPEIVEIRFDKSWFNAKSPIAIRFGGSGPIEPPAPELPIKPPTVTMATSLAWHQPKRLDSEVAFNNDTRTILKRQWLNHTTAPRALQQMGVNWETTPLVSITSRYSWDAPSAMRVDAVVQWALQPLIENQAVVNWLHSVFYRAETVLQMRNNTLIQHHHLEVVWLNSESLSDEYKMGFTSKDTRQSYYGFKWGPHAPRWNCSTKYRPPTNSNISMVFDKPYSAYQGSVTIRFTASPKYCVYDDGGGLIDAATVLPTLDFHVPIEPQIRRAYLMRPEITCTRVSDDAVIVLNSVNLSYSRSQWTPSVNLVFSSRIDSERAIGELLKIAINGYDFYVIAEQPSHSRAFGSTSYACAGRGRLAELATPYYRMANYVNTQSRSFMGLMADVLKFSGWTLESKIVDYPVPANGFSYAEKTPAEAIQLMAQSIGAMLDIDAESKKIRVLPQWPVLPWAIESAEPTITLHESVILEYSERTIVKPEANAVFVRGEQQGIAAKVKRQGTAGEKFAPDVVDMLITDNQAARMRATCELANCGDKIQTSIRTKLLNDLPPIMPGMLVGVRQGDILFKSLCDTLSISATVSSDGKVSVNQSVTLLRSTA